MTLTLRIPLPPMAKARPKFRAQGMTYMPSNYAEWSETFRDAARKQMKRAGAQQIILPVTLKVIFHGPKYPLGDVDNLVGGVMDAIQPTKKDPDPVVLKNDRQVRYPLIVDYQIADDWMVEIVLEELAPLKRPKARA